MTDTETGTIIGEGLNIQGNIRGEEDLTILGRVEGHIDLEQTLTIAETGIVKADIRAQLVNRNIREIVAFNRTAVERV